MWEFVALYHALGLGLVLYSFHHEMTANKHVPITTYIWEE